MVCDAQVGMHAFDDGPRTPLPSHRLTASQIRGGDFGSFRTPSVVSDHSASPTPVPQLSPLLESSLLASTNMRCRIRK
jgi:hypothetical protein